MAFPDTRWSLVANAAAGDAPKASAALSELCEAYWTPLYRYARHRGATAEDAEDAVQAFFARVLERGDLAAADADRGRFRTFLLTAFRNFTATRHERATAARRGGGLAFIALGVGEAEAALGASPHGDPELEFDRAWAVTLLERALVRTERAYAERGNAEMFAALRPRLLGRPGAPLAELADTLGVSLGSLKVAVHRLRARFGEAVRAEVAETVADPSRLEPELRHLRRTLRL